PLRIANFLRRLRGTRRIPNHSDYYVWDAVVVVVCDFVGLSGVLPASPSLRKR
ncbi:MAG: hypothetical protein ACI8TX_001986, partial [Hyphomicrobiaceae bacterium]